MDLSELRDYLSIVLDMEKNILLRQEMITELTKRAKPLGVPQKFKEPIRPQKYAPSVSFQENIADANLETKPPSGCLVSIGIMIFYFILFCAVSEIARNSSWVIGIFALPILIISILIGSSFDKRRDNYESRKKEQKEQEETARYMKERTETEWGKYLNDLHIYNQQISNDMKRVQKESKQKALLSQEIEELTQKQNESEQRLCEVYKKNVIFPKYRNLVAVSSLYEYICAGRCSSLEGHEGAYNIYETEIRLDRIVTQLDQIIAYLDAIRNNQFMLYTAIQEINQRCEQILQSVQNVNQNSMRILEATWGVADNISLQIDNITGQTDQISAQLQELQKTSALAAYHTERTQKELAYMNRIDYLAGRNDDVFWNQPPV